MLGKITFKTNKAQKFFSKIESRKDAAVRKKKAFVDLVDIIVFKDIMDHFKNEEGPDGEWQEWSPWRAREAKENGQSFKLQDTGTLRNNFKRGSWRRQKDGVEWYNDAKTKDGNEPYAAIHNYGGKNAAGFIQPARTFMWVSDKALKDINKTTLRFIMGK